MGEIRSTMDIIMEKTKDLTMTDGEKEDLSHRELAGKIKGLIQKFLDGITNLDRLKIEAAALREGNQDKFDQIIKDEAIKRIELEGTNKPVFTLLGNAVNIDTAPIHNVLADSEQKLGNERGVRELELRDRLKGKGISGSAVLSNIKADSEWKHYLFAIRKEFLKRSMDLKP